MKTMLIPLMAILMTSAPSFADEKGNGGGGIHCRQDGKVWTELLDLYEAEKGDYGDLTITRSEVPWRTQLEAAIQKYAQVRPSIAQKVREELARLEAEERINYFTEGPRLLPPSDTNLRKLDIPRYCSFEGVAEYKDSNGGKLDVDTYHKDSMSQTDIAALHFHEGFYKVLRNASATFNSAKARRVTALVFAQEPIQVEGVQKEIEENTISVCQNADQSLKFFINQVSSDEIEISAQTVDSIDLSERTAVTIDMTKYSRYRHIELGKRLKDGFVAREEHEASALEEQRDLVSSWYQTVEEKNYVDRIFYGLNSDSFPSFTIGLSSELGPNYHIFVRFLDLLVTKKKKNLFQKIGFQRPVWPNIENASELTLFKNFKVFSGYKNSKIKSAPHREIHSYFTEGNEELKSEIENLATTCTSVQ